MTSNGTIDSSEIKQLTTKRYVEMGAAAVAAQTGCDQACLEEQLKHSFKQGHKIDDDTMVDPYVSLKLQNQAGQTAQQYQQSAVGDIMAKLDSARAAIGKIGSRVLSSRG